MEDEKLSRRVGLRTMRSVGGVGCIVKIVIQEDSTPNNVHMVVIDGVSYYNGDSVALSKGNHDLAWLSGNGGIFDSWDVSGNISVEDETAEETVLTITCGGTLTLKLVACPSGEQIINGGFETGDLTGWTHERGQVVTDEVHTGTYSIFVYENWYQSCDMNAHKDCISSFGFWARGSGPARYKIIYTDGTESPLYSVSSPGVWTYIDVLPNVAEGKRVKNIYIEGTSVNPVWMDDFSLIC